MSRPAYRHPVSVACMLLVLLVSASVVPGGALPRATATDAPPKAERPDAVPGELIVRYRDGVDDEARDTLLDAAGAIRRDQIDLIDADVAVVDPAVAKELEAALAADPRVAWVEPNYRVHTLHTPRYPNDPQWTSVWGLDNTGQWANDVSGTPDADIDAPEAWEVTTGSAAVIVGVVDTGIDFSQPDLTPAKWINAGEDCDGCRIDGVDNDNNGYVDDWAGWDFINDDNNPFDDHGHGTHVAGTIGARGNDGTGITGVSWSVSLVALKFLDARGSGSVVDAIEALNYARDMGIRITNNSWGGIGDSRALRDAIDELDRDGVLVIAAAGNDGLSSDSVPTFPGALDVPNVISVAASDQHDQLARFSNRGARTVDLAAPGTNVYSVATPGFGVGYRYLNGTSMATPFVSGAAALLATRFPDATNHAIKAMLLRSVDALPAMQGTSTSGGRLNVNRAVRCQGPAAWLESPAPGFRAATGDEIVIRALAGDCDGTGTLSGVEVTVSVNGETLALDDRGDGLFSATWTALVDGPVSVTLSAREHGLRDDVTATGRVVREYHASNIAWEWIDATDGGTRTTIDTDDDSELIALPFPFTFYDDSYTELRITANGYLALNPSSGDSFANVAIPDRGPPNGFIAPFWDDLNPGTGGAIWYRTLGEAPQRRLVISWLDVPHYYQQGSASFQAVLHEESGAIDFQYRDIDFNNLGYNGGVSATVGVEDIGGTIGTGFSHEDGILRRYAGQTGIRFLPVNSGDPVVENLFLATAYTGEEYREVLRASGGIAPYAWSIVDGRLPAGLTLDGESGAISGVPSETGRFAFTIELRDSNDPARVIRQAYVLLAVSGYAIEDGPFSWIEAREGGSDVGIVDDDSARPVELPFIFRFYGQSFTRIQAVSNGYIVFGDGSAGDFRNVAIPDPASPNGYAAPLWDDLSPQIGGGVWTRTVGEAPQRVFVIEWAETPHYKETGSATFQIQLHEGTNVIEFHYLDADFDFSVYDFGKAATIGIENPEGSAGELFSLNTPVLEPYQANQAIRFVPTETGPAAPRITTIPPVDAFVGEPYAYQAAAASDDPLTWTLIEGPAGMTIDAATGFVSWLPDVTGSWPVTIEASGVNGSDRQSWTLSAYAGHVQVTSVDPIDGWDSETGQLLTTLGALGQVTASDNDWLPVRGGYWLSLAFTAAVPADAQIVSARIIVEHHEDYGTPEESIRWEAALGPLESPGALGSQVPLVAPSLSSDKLVEWDVTAWFSTPEAVNGALFVVRNDNDLKRTLLDRVQLVVSWVGSE